MARLLLIVCISLQVLWLNVSAQAPDDADEACTNPTNFRIEPPEYAENQLARLDTRHYSTLLDFVTNGPLVWTPADLDSHGDTWTLGLRSLCLTQVRSCTYRGPFPQQNVLYTQWVNTAGCNEVNVQINYRFSGGGYDREFDVLVYDTTGMSHLESHDIDNYKMLNTITSTRSTGSSHMSYLPKANNRGVYFAFRENGTCTTLQRVLAYCDICSDSTVGLVHRNQTFAPSRSSGVAVEVQGDCLPNSSLNRGESTHPLLQCTALGVWLDNEDCECNPGYMMMDSNNRRSCQACPAGMYKGTYSNEDRCIPCPGNSESAEGASSCRCRTGFYRKEGENSGVKCTAPPSAPAGCRITGTKNTSISVEWENPTEDGGRNDVCFNIFYQKTGLLHEGFIMAASGVKGLEYTLPNLKPLTDYSLKIVSENGVSDQSRGTEQLRSVVHQATTNEGVPEKITVFALRRGSTLTWQPPSVTNGNVTGFCMRVYREGGEDDARVIEFDPLEFCFSPSPNEIPAGNGPVYAQIQAKTVIGGGVWSNPVGLPIEPPVVDVRCPSLQAPNNGQVLQSGSTIDSIATYSCNPSFQLVGDNTRECRAGGTWSGSVPTCEATTVRCNLLRAPSNGRVSQSGTNAGSVATYICIGQYQLVGVSNRMCQPDGTWTGDIPVCQAACGSLVGPSNGQVSQSGNTFGFAATYSCSDGYVMIGSSTRVCLLDGHWSGDAPQCRATCDSLNNPTSGIVSITRVGSPGIPPDSQAVYSCNGGFTLSGNSVRDCQSDGTWSGSEPTCTPQAQIVTCSSLDNPSNGAVSVSGNAAVYSCTAPYELQGVTTRTCVNGQWTGVAPTCQLPPLRFELNGTPYASGSSILALDIGAGDNNCLKCITDRTDCCGSPNRAGQFFYPNTTQVPIQREQHSFYRNRKSQYICLNRQGSGVVTTGTYRCEIPDSNGNLNNLFITIN